ncbi:hypothetical protein FRC09_019423 [Ceratobasidium sp. 395]|nr:hypothetical protein FRC09_019423 [Ceratobasidium sp. 395]
MSSHSKLVDGGATLIETVTRPADGKATDTPLDQVTVHDGFYRIVQYDDNGNELSAYADDSTQDQIVMGDIPQLTGSAEWMFTGQWGPIKNGFTIAPKGNSSVSSSTNPQFYGSTVISTDLVRQLVIGSVSRFGVWEVRCDESRTYRLKDGSTKTIYYFRIIEPGRGFDIPQGVWKTTMLYDSPTLVLSEKVSWDPIDPKQLYELIPLGVVHPTVDGPGRITA